MLENSVVSVGLKLNELAAFEVGAGVVLLTLKDAGKDSRTLTYSDLHQALSLHLAPRLARYRVENPQPIVDALLKYLQDYQSVFTMAAR